jgi:hypothetical protein
VRKDIYGNTYSERKGIHGYGIFIRVGFFERLPQKRLGSQGRRGHKHLLDAKIYFSILKVQIPEMERGK